MKNSKFFLLISLVSVSSLYSMYSDESSIKCNENNIELIKIGTVAKTKSLYENQQRIELSTLLNSSESHTSRILHVVCVGAEYAQYISEFCIRRNCLVHDCTFNNSDKAQETFKRLEAMYKKQKAKIQTVAKL